MLARMPDPTLPQLTVVLPCLNEIDTLGICIQKAQRAFQVNGIAGEVVVADNGSTDGSQAQARALGAQVVDVPSRGYGSALQGGIAAARSRYILMADCDDSYDLSELGSFFQKINEGFDIVQGCRLPAGGGRLMPGSMPFSHRWLGNPLFSFLARGMFAATIDDVYCGMRIFTRELYDRLDLRCTGMEFAVEMIIKSSLYGAKMGQVPIVYHPDGRKSHPPHLRTFRDGWRTLRFLLMYNPKWLFNVPGNVLVAAGALGYALALPGVRLMGATLDAHTLLCASLAIVLGYQANLFATFTRTFAISEGLLPPDPAFEKQVGQGKLEMGILRGLVMVGLGVLLILGALQQWRQLHFGRLDYAQTMRWVIPGVLLITLGSQRVLGSFFLGILQLKRR
jgi:glycosyltransferase involved in cell wall biosynthesis